MKRTVTKGMSLLIYLIIIAAGIFFPITGPARAANARLYKNVLLNIDWSIIKGVGKQAPNSEACSCFALAYCRSMLDGKAHKWYEYNSDGWGTSETNVWCNWGKGRYTNDGIPSKDEVFRRLYNEVSSGDPIIVRVSGRGSINHYVVVVGISNATETGTLSEANFLIIDTIANSGYVVENMDSVGYDLLAYGGKYQIVYDASNASIGFQTREGFCNHNSFQTIQKSDGSYVARCKVSGCGYEYPIQVSSSGAGKYQVTAKASLCTYPYQDSRTDTQVSVGDILSVTGSTVNAYGKIWYQLINGLWIYSNHVTYKEPLLKYFLNVNGILDGNLQDGTGSYGTFDVYINGTLVANDVKDYYKQWTEGTSYEVSDIKATNSHSYAGVQMHPLSGTINKYTEVNLKFNTTSTTCTVNFEPNGGSCSTSSMSVAKGGPLTSLPTATRNGYTFQGWYFGEYYSSRANINSTFSNNCTLYAHWALSADSGNKIIFNTNGGALPEPVLTLSLDDINGVRNTGQLVAYDWSGEMIGTNEYGREVAVNASGCISAIRNYGSTNRLSVPTGGFILSGHKSGGDSDGAALIDQIITLSDNNDLFVRLDYANRRVLAYDSENAYSTFKYVQNGNSYGILPTPVREGFFFDGWYTAASGGTQVTPTSIYSASTLYAHWRSQSDYEYDLDDNEEATITGYTGSNTVLAIPSYIDGYKVTAIGASAFSHNTEIVSITIPEGVTNIGQSAFSYCSGLISVVIPESVTTLGGNAFLSCTSLTEIALPSQLAKIDAYTFINCSSLWSVTIPAAVTFIQVAAFSSCDALTDVFYTGTLEQWQNMTIKDHNESLSNARNHYTLDYKYYCDYNSGNDLHEVWILEYYGGGGEIEIPGSINGNPVSYIARHAFSFQDNLLSISVPSSVVSIGEYAFNNCSNLCEVTLQEGLTEICRHAFSNCPNLSSINLPNTLTHLGDSAFYFDTNLCSIYVPSGVTNIGFEVFRGCSNLVSISLERVDSFGDYAFADCAMSEFHFGDIVTSIGEYAFFNCTNLRKLTIPSSVAFIGFAAFGQCDNLNEIHYCGSWDQWGNVEIGAGNDLLHTYRVWCDLTINDISPNVLGDYSVGVNIAWIAITSGGNGTIEYEFYVYRDGEQVYQFDNGNNPIFFYTPMEPGTYHVLIHTTDQATQKSVWAQGGFCVIDDAPSAVQITDNVYTLTPLCATGSHLSLSDAGTNGSSAIIDYASSESNYQRFRFESTGDGYYVIYEQSCGGRYVLGVPNGTTEAETTVTLSTYIGAEYQQWKISDAGDGYCYISPRHAPDMCLDVYYASSEPNTPVNVYYKNYTNAQEWKLERVSDAFIPMLTDATASAGQISVKWNSVSGATAYAVYRREGSASWTRLTNTFTGTSYADKDSTLKAGISYSYYVRALVGGTWSGNSNVLSATAQASTVPVLTSATASAGQITVKWNAFSGASKYAVYRKAAGESSWTRLTNTVTGTSYTDKSTDLKAGTTYYYTVRAYVGSAWGSYDSKGVSAKAE